MDSSATLTSRLEDIANVISLKKSVLSFILEKTRLFAVFCGLRSILRSDSQYITNFHGR